MTKSPYSTDSPIIFYNSFKIRDNRNIIIDNIKDYDLNFVEKIINGCTIIHKFKNIFGYSQIFYHLKIYS